MGTQNVVRISPASSSTPKSNRTLGHRSSQLLGCGIAVLIAFLSRFGVDSSNVIRNMRSSLKPIAWMCLLLTFWSAFAFVAHHHSSATEAAKCTVCVAAHSASPKTVSTLPNATFVPVATFRPKPVSAKQRVIAFALCVRPPPGV